MAMDTHWSPIPILDTDWSPMIQHIKITMYTSENAALSAKQDVEANRACGGDFLSAHAKREFTQLKKWTSVSVARAFKYFYLFLTQDI